MSVQHAPYVIVTGSVKIEKIVASICLPLLRPKNDLLEGFVFSTERINTLIISYLQIS